MVSGGLKWMCLIIGTMIGAGYASGRELWEFFGHESGLAILLFTVMFSASCLIILHISYQSGSSDYVGVLHKLMGRKVTVLYDGLIIMYLFTTSGVMVAGGGATMQTFQIPYWVGVLIISSFLVLLFVWDVNGLTSVNSLIIPILITSLLFTLVVFQWESGNALFFEEPGQRNWPAAFTFTALNILPLVAVLSAVGNKIKHEGEIWIASIGSGLILGGLSFLYNQSLIVVASDIMLYEIPLFAILNAYPYGMLLFMAFLLWMAIFTTAASGIFGLVSRVKSWLPWPAWVLSIMFLLLMIPMTSIGFSNLVAFLYPLYGLLNLYLLGAVLLYPFLQGKNTL
ncbi:hypothetical protein ACFPU1_02445 [Thalassorhabdus alkalitolerans]|uniref:Membrane protein YkvI n=1 Tax=Thalassorhabdus alkalitolerans TaxID=2282697 RepID=A0ABW0YNF1_9BACI